MCHVLGCFTVFCPHPSASLLCMYISTYAIPCFHSGFRSPFPAIPILIAGNSSVSACVQTSIGLITPPWYLLDSDRYACVMHFLVLPGAPINYISMIMQTARTLTLARSIQPPHLVPQTPFQTVQLGQLSYRTEYSQPGFSSAPLHPLQLRCDRSFAIRLQLLPYPLSCSLWPLAGLTFCGITLSPVVRFPAPLFLVILYPNPHPKSKGFFK